MYSIASSSSPSKGDGAPTAESTSPESPNRDRMASYPEQNFNRDIQCKSLSSINSSWTLSTKSFKSIIGKPGQTPVDQAAKSFAPQQQPSSSSQTSVVGPSPNMSGPRPHHTMAASQSRPTVTSSLPSPVTHNAMVAAGAGGQPMPRNNMSAHDSFVKPNSTHLHHQQMYQQQQQLHQQQRIGNITHEFF